MPHRPFSYGLILVMTLLSALGMGVPPTAGADQADNDTQPNRIKLSECLADVKEVTAWEPESTRSAAVNLCQLRRRNATQQKRFATALVKLQNLYKGHTNHGFDQHLPTAKQDARAVVKSCIEFKSGFTYPHNIGTLTIPEEIYASCYELGSKLVETELSR